MAELVGLDHKELEAVAIAHGQPGYRGKQLATWIYRKNVLEFSGMTDLPQRMRAALAEARIEGGGLAIERVQEAADGTAKFLFSSSLGGMIESVAMPSSDRMSVCISTQIGCAVGCAFCETGLSGFSRDLTAGEMLEQVLRIQAKTGKRVTHVVFMGMGEPLFNYDATIKAIRLLNAEAGIGMRHLTVSTSGVVPGIMRLAEEDLQLTLALSLHAPTDALRDTLVPLNRRYPLGELHNAVADYETRTGRRLTLEYVMLRGINDTPEIARQTASWMKGLHCHLNLIPYNATDATFAPSTPAAIAAFRAVIEEAGFPVTVRQERGSDINAACGQLRRQALPASGGIVARAMGEQPGALAE